MAKETKFQLTFTARDEASKVAEDLASNLEDVGEKLTTGIDTALDKIPSSVDDVFEDIATSAEGAGASTGGRFGGALGVAMGVGLGTAAKLLEEGMGNALESGLGLDPKTANILSDGLMGAVGMIPLIAGPALAGVGSTIGGILAAAVPIGMALLPFLLVAALVAAVAFLVMNPDILGKIAEFAGNIVSGIIDGLIGLGGMLIGLFTAAFGAIITAAGAFVGSVVEFIVGIPGKLVDFALAFVQLYADIWVQVIRGVGKFVGDVVEFIVGIPGKLVDFALAFVQLYADIATDVLTGVGTFVGSVVSAILGIPGKLISFASDIVGKLLGPLQTVLQTVQDIVDGLLRAVGLTGSMDKEFKGSATPPDGSHAAGLLSVPFDGYRALLHQGEMIVPKSAAEGIRSGAGGGGLSIGNVNITVNGGDSQGDIDRKVMQALKRAANRERMTLAPTTGY